MATSGPLARRPQINDLGGVDVFVWSRGEQSMRTPEAAENTNLNGSSVEAETSAASDGPKPTC
jgi:hypothetical protein